MVTVCRVYTVIIDYLFDIRYGIDTRKKLQLSELNIVGGNKEKAFAYEPTRLVPLRKFFKQIKPMIPPETVLVDIGCGKGRVLLGTLKLGFNEVRGIDFASELCEIAKKNYTIYTSKKLYRTRCKVIENDVTNYHIKTDENIFFFNNPFDKDVLSKVLCNIADSVQIKQREILIIYHNAEYPHVFEQYGDFSKLKEVIVYGYKFIVYSNLASITDRYTLNGSSPA